MVTRTQQPKQALESIVGSANHESLSNQERDYLIQQYERFKSGKLGNYSPEIRRSPRKRQFLDSLRDNDLIRAIVLRNNGASGSEIFHQTGISRSECREAISGRMDCLLDIATPSEREILKMIARHPEYFAYNKPSYRTVDKSSVIKAIILKDRGIPYSEALEQFDVNPDSFYLFVFSRLEELIGLAQGREKVVLERIAKDEKRKKNLIRMDEEFIAQQYDRMFGRIPGEKQLNYFNGTLKHPDNRECLAYYALTSNNEVLKSGARKKIVDFWKGYIARYSSSPHSLASYFAEIGLIALMGIENEALPHSNVLQVLMLYDSHRQKTDNDKSLFDLTQLDHLHTWDFMPSLLEDIRLFLTSVDHSISHYAPVLFNDTRAKAVEFLKKADEGITNYFERHGVSRRYAARHGYNVTQAVLKRVDDHRKKMYHEPSLTSDAKLPFVPLRKNGKPYWNMPKTA